MAHCIRHFEEPMVDTCRTCGRPFCDRCLVYAFGPNKPPFCVGCALDASGVRTPTKVVAVAKHKPSAAEKRAAKAERKAAKAEAKAAARAARAAARGPVDGGDPGRDSTVPVPPSLIAPSRYVPNGDDQPVT